MSPRRKMGKTRRQWLAIWLMSIGAQMQIAAGETPDHRAAPAFRVLGKAVSRVATWL